LPQFQVRAVKSIADLDKLDNTLDSIRNKKYSAEVNVFNKELS